MAEFCRECFVEKLLPPQEEIDHIVMSEENSFCEGCGAYGEVVYAVSTHIEKE